MGRLRELRLLSPEKGDLIVVYLKGRVMTREPGLPAWYPLTGQRKKAKGEIQRVLVKCKKY